MKLNELSDNDGARYKSKRLGRGIGSGKGKTSGRGVKGQKARTGVAVDTFEGGQTPLYMKLPKRGFKSINRIAYSVITTGKLQSLVEAGKISPKDEITVESLRSKGFVNKKYNRVKLLVKGELKTALNIKVTAASVKARSVVESAGGKLELPA